MHEYKRFIQEQMDQRGWRQADLVRASGLSRANVSRILKDDRPRLGQMPDESTLVALARAFAVSVETVRTAAARALRGYVDDGAALSADLSSVSIDALLEEVRRRVVHANQNPSSPSSTPPPHGGPGDRRTPMTLVPDTDDVDELHAARDVDGPTEGELRRRPGADAGEEDQGEPGDGA